MEQKLKQHWTSSTVENFVFQIASDFTLQLEKKLEAGPVTNKELAQRLKITAGRVSQVLNNPGNFKLRSMTEYARALGLKVSVVAYEDDDPDNSKGPINSEVFYECWKRAGKPRDFFDLNPHMVVRPVHYGSSPMPAATGSGECAPSVPNHLNDLPWQAVTTQILLVN